MILTKSQLREIFGDNVPKAYIVYDLEQNIVGVITDRFYRNKEELEEELYREYKTRKFDIDIFYVEESKLFFTARNLLDGVK